jgi:hypothetical protein
MRGLGRDRLGAACLAVGVGVVALLAFGTPRASADPPVFDPIANQMLEATSSAGAPAFFTATATDDSTYTVSCDHNSGDVFPLGSTTVTCTATDDTDNTQGMTSFTVDVVDTTPPDVTPPANITAEAAGASGSTVTFAASATDIVDGGLTPTCTPASGANFPLGTTSVTCTATDAHSNTGSATFTVTVQDSTPPTLGPMPADKTGIPAASAAGTIVNYTPPTATDAVDPSPNVSCNPSSGSTFQVGNTTVSCTASDSSGNTSAAGTFLVNVVDTFAPSFTGMPGNMNVNATGPGGASVSYTPPGATDNVDPSPNVSCSPAPGSTFPLGTTNVDCTASDSSGNQASGGFAVTVADSAAPTLTTPGNQTAEATGPSGATVGFSVTASDNVDPNPTVNCVPASGSTFALGSTNVSCTARDSSGNTSGSASFTVTVVDTTPPAFSNVPAPTIFEANTGNGTVLGYPSPTAFDLVSGAIPVVICSPPSGSGFAIGTTLVRCTARDAAGNTGVATFPITVADRTPPVISAPPSLSLYATTPTGVPASDPSVANAERYITATDSIDPHPTISSDMPSFLPLGHTLVHFFAVDKYGNRAGVNMDVLVIKPPASGPVPPLPNPDVQPPDNVSNLSARPGSRTVTLSWTRPTASDFDHVVVLRSDPSASTLGDAVYNGKAVKYVDKGLTNGTQYRYVVVSYDKSGNRSVGLAILATPEVRKLTHPLNGAALKKPPVLTWLPVGEADYYNVQLFRESTTTLSESYLTGSKKILSTWPVRSKLPLKKQWKFQGHTYRLTPGRYRWFVWAGFGRRADEKYGPLLGQSLFLVKK